MNVTFLIGNGFDLACGLNTSYISFLDYYLGYKSSKESINVFKSQIRKDISTWADAEIAFGDYTRNYNVKSEEIFRECRDDFLIALVYYLGIQENKISVEMTKKTREGFKRGLLFYDFSLPERSRDILYDIYKSESINTRSYNFIVFNYTNIFEQILKEQIDSKHGMESAVLITGQLCENKFDKLVYIHGERRNPPVIFGVDNARQIANKDLLDLPRFTRAMMKPMQNNELNKRKVSNCLDIIDQSSIICIYGMSIGKTDSMWWSRIVKWMHADSAHQLIYYAWSPTCNRVSASSYLDSLDDCRVNLYYSLMLTDEEVVKFRDQIHIEVNFDLFGLSIVSEEFDVITGGYK